MRHCASSVQHFGQLWEDYSCTTVIPLLHISCGIHLKHCQYSLQNWNFSVTENQIRNGSPSQWKRQMWHWIVHLAVQQKFSKVTLLENVDITQFERRYYETTTCGPAWLLEMFMWDRVALFALRVWHLSLFVLTHNTLSSPFSTRHSLEAEGELCFVILSCLCLGFVRPPPLPFCFPLCDGVPGLTSFTSKPRAASLMEEPFVNKLGSLCGAASKGQTLRARVSARIVLPDRGVTLLRWGKMKSRRSSKAKSATCDYLL